MNFASLSATRHTEQRWEVIKTAIAMNAAGINAGKSGNVSLRIESGFLNTPTGMEYDNLQRDDIVAMKLDGSFDGTILPSSEWRFHRDIYAARPEITAIVHTHSAFATTIACHHREIPAFHYMVAAAGGDNIRCAPYATFGTQALSDAAVSALDGRLACLLAQHGMIACGPSLKKALALAIEVETLAQMYWQALQIGAPPILDATEMRAVLEKFQNYGQQTAD